MAPAQKPGKSKQDYATPDAFIVAVKRRLKIERFSHDFAADGSNTKALEHVSIAESVLGRDMRPAEQIHHVNGKTRDNRHSNLVICQDQAYHHLLHVRARVVRGGGNPNIDRLCTRCHKPHPRTQMAGHRCRPCGVAYRQELKSRRSAA